MSLSQHMSKDNIDSISALTLFVVGLLVSWVAPGIGVAIQSAGFGVALMTSNEHARTLKALQQQLDQLTKT